MSSFPESGSLLERAVPRLHENKVEEHKYKPGERQAYDPVNNPEHYTFGGIETIDFIEAKRLNFNKGNAVKYITRAGVKSPMVIEDLQKAIWYLNREIDCINKQNGLFKKSASKNS